MQVIEAAGLVITSDERPDVTVVALEGDVDASNVGALVTALQLARANVPARLVVDIRQVTSLSSDAIRALSDFSTKIHSFCLLEIEGPSPFLRTALEIADARLLKPEP